MTGNYEEPLSKKYGAKNPRPKLLVVRAAVLPGVSRLLAGREQSIREMDLQKDALLVRQPLDTECHYLP